MSLTSKDYLKQIAKSKGVHPLTNEVKDNALLFPVGFKNIFQDLERLEKLENQAPSTIDYILSETLGVSAESYADLQNENQKLKKVIKFLGEQLGLEVDLENHNLITEEGTIGFVNADEETMSILELLREVLEEWVNMMY